MFRVRSDPTRAVTYCRLRHAGLVRDVKGGRGGFAGLGLYQGPEYSGIAHTHCRADTLTSNTDHYAESLATRLTYRGVRNSGNLGRSAYPSSATALRLARCP